MALMLSWTGEMVTDVRVHSDPTAPCMDHLAVQPAPIPLSGTRPTCSFSVLIHLEGRSVARVARRQYRLRASRADAAQWPSGFVLRNNSGASSNQSLLRNGITTSPRVRQPRRSVQTSADGRGRAAAVRFSSPSPHLLPCGHARCSPDQPPGRGSAACPRSSGPRPAGRTAACCICPTHRRS